MFEDKQRKAIKKRVLSEVVNSRGEYSFTFYSCEYRSLSIDSIVNMIFEDYCK